MSSKGRPERPEREVFDEPLERALSWAALPEARSEFKARLREGFLAGADVRGEHATAVASRAAGARTLTPRAPVLHARADQVRRVRTWAAVLAVAAGVVIVGLIWRARVAPWRVLGGTGAELVQSDGKRVPLTVDSHLPELLASGRTVETKDGVLRLQIADDCLVSIMPNSRVVLPEPGTREDIGALELRVERGAIDVATGPMIKKRGMRVLTSHVEADVVGTSFGVDVYPDYTCVCCFHGTVKVITHEGGTKAVSDGHMCIGRDHGEATEGDAYGPHLAPVKEVDKQAHEIWDN